MQRFLGKISGGRRLREDKAATPTLSASSSTSAHSKLDLLKELQALGDSQGKLTSLRVKALILYRQRQGRSVGLIAKELLLAEWLPRDGQETLLEKIKSCSPSTASESQGSGRGVVTSNGAIAPQEGGKGSAAPESAASKGNNVQEALEAAKGQNRSNSKSIRIDAGNAEELAAKYQELIGPHPNSLPESDETDVQQNKRSSLASLLDEFPSAPGNAERLAAKYQELIGPHPNSLPESDETDVQQNKRTSLASLLDEFPSPPGNAERLAAQYQELIGPHPNSLPESGEADVRQNKRSPLTDMPKQSPSPPRKVKSLVKQIEEAKRTAVEWSYSHRPLPNLPTKKDGT